MKDGRWVYYHMEHRKVAEGPVREEGPMKPCRDYAWAWSSWEYFNNAMTSNQEPPNLEAADVYNKTGNHGWWTLRYAIQALKRLRNFDKKGRYDSRGFLGNKVIKRVRHEFRIVKMTVSQKTEVITKKG